MHALAATSSANPLSSPFDVLIILIGIAAYWVPSIVAGTRHVPHFGSIVVINLFLGWTIIGWVAALAMACRSHSPQVTYAPSAPQPGSDRS